MTRRILALLVLAALIAPAHASAQSLKDRLKSKAQERVDRNVDGAMDKLLDRIERAARCVAGDDECVEQARRAKKDVVLTDEEGNILPADEQPEGSPAANRKANEAAAAKAGAGETAKAADGDDGPAKSASKPEAAWDNFDFVPGARVLFADDFTRERVGNFPRRLEMSSGNAQVVEWKGGRWLSAAGQGLTIFALPLPEKLPPRWTMEMDITIPWWGMAIYAADKPDRLGALTQDRAVGYIRLSGTEAGVIRPGSGGEGSKVDPRTSFPDMTPEDARISRPFKLRVESDNNYMKVYLDQVRISNIPNATFASANKIWFEVEENGGHDGQPQAIMIGNVSVNAGGKDMYDALLADGRLAVQGIYFDVNSDVIRPESSGTLKQIGDMLTQHADLKLTIEGHTDNTGNAAANQTLSEKRAAAVVKHLADKFGIAPARLTSKGFGPSKPAASNDTPEGRQANRRVELVKM